MLSLSYDLSRKPALSLEKLLHPTHHHRVFLLPWENVRPFPSPETSFSLRKPSATGETQLGSTVPRFLRQRTVLRMTWMTSSDTCKTLQKVMKKGGKYHLLQDKYLISEKTDTFPRQIPLFLFFFFFLCSFWLLVFLEWRWPNKLPSEAQDNQLQKKGVCGA